MTKHLSVLIFILLIFWLASTSSAQPQPEKTVLPIQTGDISRERREKGLAKLLEAQRYYWTLKRINSPAAVSSIVKLIKQTLAQAIDSDPTLAEAYALSAELNVYYLPNNLSEAARLAQTAIKLNPDNFGAHLILAQIYTVQSQINNDNLDQAAALKAINEWKEVARLDPRNAEAWAFLSEFYQRTNQTEAQIFALNKWLSATPQADENDPRRLLGAVMDLSPVNASLKLGELHLKAGRNEEAIEILGRSVAAYPENPLTIDLLRQALQNNEGEISPRSLEIIQQAVYSNPTNFVLVELLAEHQSRLGRTDDAIKTINNTIATFGQGNKSLTANFQLAIGDIYFQANQNDEAALAYEQALRTMGIERSALSTEDQREFATRVYEKIIRSYKSAGKLENARSAIDTIRVLLGKSDSFADKQMILLLRETGKKNEALVQVKSARRNFHDDYSLIRTESLILTELGRVDEGVAIIKSLISKKAVVPSPYYDDFSNYLFIAGLYTQVKRNKEAIMSAQKAIELAEGEERRQLATLSLATAQNQSGNFKLAETILQEILKKTPENPIALNNLGYFWLERNEKLEEAVKLIHRALKIDSNNPSYLDSLGWGYYKLNQLDKAERFLKQALRFNSTSSNIYEHLGDLYLKQGKIEQARSAWQKAVTFSTNPENSTRLKNKLAKGLVE